MTTALATPPARRTSSCDVAINNINMILAVLHIPKKEVAEALGKMPQSFSRMLKNGYQWTFDDMLEVSDILQVGLDDLTNPDLTPNRVIEARAKNGGYNVAVDGDGRIRWGMAGLLGVLGWSHNPEVHGSNPCPATNRARGRQPIRLAVSCVPWCKGIKGTPAPLQPHSLSLNPCETRAQRRSDTRIGR